MLSKKNVELKQEEAELQVINKKHHELTQENQQLQEKLEKTQAEDNQTIVKERQNSDLQDKLGEERPEFDIPENEYENFQGDTMRAPREAFREQLVKIQLRQSLANRPKTNHYAA